MLKPSPSLHVPVHALLASAVGWCAPAFRALPSPLAGRRLPETFKADIEKACKSIFPLQNVSVRKVKMLKSPKFDRTWAGPL